MHEYTVGRKPAGLGNRDCHTRRKGLLITAHLAADMRGQWSGGTDWLRRSDQADLERRDLPWLRRSRPLMLDMQVSGLRDIAAGMSVVGGSLSRLRRFGFAPRSWSRCRTACAEGGGTVAVEFVAVGHAAGHGHDQGQSAAGHQIGRA